MRTTEITKTITSSPPSILHLKFSAKFNSASGTNTVDGVKTGKLRNEGIKKRRINSSGFMLEIKSEKSQKRRRQRQASTQGFRQGGGDK